MSNYYKYHEIFVTEYQDIKSFKPLSANNSKDTAFNKLKDVAAAELGVAGARNVAVDQWRSDVDAAEIGDGRDAVDLVKRRIERIALHTRLIGRIDAEILDSPAPPAYCTIRGNIGCNSNPSQLEGDNFVFNRNRYFRQNFFEPDPNGQDPVIFESVYMFGTVSDNLDYTDNPEEVFVNPAEGNFFLKEDSKVYRDIVGFEKWDYSLIGPQKNK